jgi:hypothetical protein
MPSEPLAKVIEVCAAAGAISTSDPSEADASSCNTLRAIIVLRTAVGLQAGPTPEHLFGRTPPIRLETWLPVVVPFDF